MTAQATPYRLSVVMIVKNEARHLADCLNSIADIADEIIILDSGSTDDSYNIAKSFGVKWYVNTDWQGFGKQRQIAQSYATGDWILVLDADEEIDPKLYDSIIKIKHKKPENTVYGIKRIDYIFGHAIDHPYWAIKAHWRLYPKKFTYNDNAVHESLNLYDAQTKVLSGFIRHQTAPTPLFWLQKRLDYAKAWANDRHKQGKRVSIFAVVGHTFWAFIKQYIVDGRFLQGSYGLIYALLFTQYTFNKYAILYDLSHNRADNAFLQQQKALTTLSPIAIANKKSTLSVVMIVKNEARHLADCLKSIADIADEIIILDSGSTDDSYNIAKSFGVKWYVNTNWQGFGKQRQIAQSYATGDWILALDADERPTQALRQAIANLLTTPVHSDNVFSVARVNQFCGIEVQQRWWYSDKLARVYANHAFQYSDLAVHESLHHNSSVQLLDGYLIHLTNDNLAHFLVKNIRYSYDWAVDKHQKGKKISLIGILLHSWVSFMREYIIRADILGSSYGFILAFASLGYTLDKYIMLWQMNKTNKTQTINRPSIKYINIK